jgi:hypothetical protein
VLRVNAGATALEYAAASGGSPAGSGTELQYRDGSSFGAMAGTAWDNTNRSLTMTGATVTTSNPVLNLTQTWNNAGVTFTGLLMTITNTASSSSSNLIDLKVGATSQFYVSRTGGVVINGSFQNSTGDYLATSTNWTWGASGVLRWANTTAYGTVDIALQRETTGVLQLRHSTTAQTFKVYNTWTNASNGEWGECAWASNVFLVGTEKNGTGTAREMGLQTDGTTRLTIGASGGLTLADANDVAVGTTTGTKIGTATSQKLGFWNATPIVQPTTAVSAATVAATGTGDVVAASTTFDGYTMPQVVKALRNAGILA